ncbi:MULTISPECIES: helix-turn-helix domain-containing protein [Methylophaga]
MGLCECDFHLPINQSLIGDALAISPVHVSRTFKIFT